VTTEQRTCAKPVAAMGQPVVPGSTERRCRFQKAGKNRLHPDFRPVDQTAEVERLLSRGARRADVGQHDASWMVLADPEGNEFCILRGWVTPPSLGSATPTASRVSLAGVRVLDVAAGSTARFLAADQRAGVGGPEFH
jgi:hypothetical protein